MKGWMRLAKGPQGRRGEGAGGAGEKKRPSAPSPFHVCVGPGGGVSPFSKEGPSKEHTAPEWYQGPLHPSQVLREGPSHV